MSRCLLYPIPDWPALSVACTMLSSVKSGKSLSRDRHPTSPQISAARCSCRIVWPGTRIMWLMRLTPRLSRRRAKFCLWTRSCIARMTSALAKSRSAMNWGSHGNSECGASSGSLWRGHVLHVSNSPLRRCYTQVVHAVDDFRFQWAPLSSDSGIGNVEVPAEKVAPGLGDT